MRCNLWNPVYIAGLRYPPDPMIAAACFPVSSVSLVTICVSECVQESGVRIVISPVYGCMWSYREL